MPNPNRREFLKGSMALGGAALAGSAVAAENVASRPARRGANEEIRVAVVGVRSRGKDHIKGHLAGRNVRVVALCDVDESAIPAALKLLEGKGPTPRTEVDVRRLLDARDIDCISIATPNHWHSLAAIWACQAGKDAYVEKPCSHNVFEGRKLVEAARKYKRIVAHGTQSRTSEPVREAIKLLREGIIGDVYMARALCFKKRDSIGMFPDEPAAPAGVHYDLWLGPAPERPFNKNRFHYQWHWNWDYGNGDIGNQGVHQMDIARWGLGKGLPVRIHSMGGRYTYIDQGETPNTLVSTFQYPDGAMLVFEVRGRQTHSEWDVAIGNLFYGSKGYMAVGARDFRTVIDGRPGPGSTAPEASLAHFANFHKAMRSRRAAALTAEIEEGHLSSAMCHLANISYRLGRALQFDPVIERFVADRDADEMLTRDYRKPYVVPENV